MPQWEIQVEKQHHGQPFPEVLIPGEGAFPEKPFTPPSSFPDPPLDLPPAGHREFLRKSQLLARVMQHLQAAGLSGQEPAHTFPVHLYRRNCRPNTLRAYAGAIQLFLTFLRHHGKAHLEALTREDLEAFLEQEQDRGLKITTVRSRLGLVKAWVRFLIDREVVRPEVLARNITIKLPESLPRALDPEDVKQLLAVITKVRDRALVLLLLRTGMRIGEVLSATVNDLNLRERKILIYQAEKTQVGRVVSFSDDAREALRAWLAERDPHQPQLFHARGRDSLGYTAARVTFLKYLTKAGLSQKGYCLHCLRHTFASELLNAGLRLECLQQLLGHAKLEMTRRYARLTDRTREEEYFRALARIEREKSMAIINAIVNFRRFLKRRNHSSHTVKHYLNRVEHFVVWLDVPLEEVTPVKVLAYIDHLLERRLQPSTINHHLLSIRRFYDYLAHEEGVAVGSPVKRGQALRLPKPLPRCLKEEEVTTLFGAIRRPRDRALFLLMLRSGLRVEEVANLTLEALDLTRGRVHVHHGKGGKDRVVYISPDTHRALTEYLQRRPRGKARQVFLVEKGPYTGKPLSVRGIQKRLEYYARKTRVTASCHHLRHTMATQLLNADADLATIQDLLGHTWITTTQRYCRVSNLKVRRDYYKAMEVVMHRTLPE